jgi:hypothetical protein
MPRYLSKLARALTLTAMLAAMNLAGVTAVAQAHATDQATVAETGRPVTSPQQAAADTAHRRQLAQERSSVPDGAPTDPAGPTRPTEPGGQPGWLTPALGMLAAVLALVAGVAALAARRANRTRAGQTA